MSRRRSRRSAWRRVGSLTDPFPVKMFKDYVKRWSRWGGAILCDPKRTRTKFDRIIFTPRRVGFFETMWVMTAMWDFVPKDCMNELYAEVYRSLKPLECKLQSKGFLKRRYFFTSDPVLAKLEERIPGFKISDKLANELNRSETIMRLIHTIKPAELTVSLLSIPPEFQPFVKYEEALLKGMVSFYAKPESISWIVSLSKMFNRWFGIRKEADAIIRLTNSIFKILRRKSRKIEKLLEPT